MSAAHTAGRRRKRYPPEVCVWCKRVCADGAKVSGWTGDGPDPMIDGDFGCDASPESDAEGCGRHLTHTSFLFMVKRAAAEGGAK